MYTTNLTYMQLGFVTHRCTRVPNHLLVVTMKTKLYKIKNNIYSLVI